jgi:hypothetical protein
MRRKPLLILLGFGFLLTGHLALLTQNTKAVPVRIIVVDSAGAAKCAATPQARVYSNAHLVEETGDFVGWDMAVLEQPDSTTAVTLYDYEGELNDEAIRVTGRISGKKLTAKGTWIEHLIEHPQQKEVVKTHTVIVDGTIDSSSFRGAIRVDDINSDGKILLERVAHMSGCKS